MKMVALLRAINVGGNRSVPMAELKALATKLGLKDPANYIQSGNLVFDAGSLKPAEVELKLEKAIAKKFGFDVPVIVRTATEWKKYSSAKPFPDVIKIRAKMVHLGLSKEPCPKGVEKTLVERALAGERIKIAGDAIWVDFNQGAGVSKLTPAWFDKCVGSSVTMRNWNTVQKLAEMLGE
jgi:uncharacterized protein (DUF1697 family)